MIVGVHTEEEKTTHTTTIIMELGATIEMILGEISTLKDQEIAFIMKVLTIKSLEATTTTEIIEVIKTTKIIRETIIPTQGTRRRIIFTPGMIGGLIIKITIERRKLNITREMTSGIGINKSTIENTIIGIKTNMKIIGLNTTMITERKSSIGETAQNLSLDA